jgi:hypothetical protein
MIFFAIYENTILMADNKSITDKRDSSKIDSNDPGEVEYVHSLFPDLEHQNIVDAIEAAGPEREKVYAYIRKKHNIEN